MRGWHKEFGVAVTAVAVVAGITACGSSNDNATTGAGGATSTSAANLSPAITAAKADVAKYEKAQAPLVVPALGKPIPKGKTIAVLTCPLPVCQQSSQATQRAAKALGWTTKTFNNPLTPEGYVAAWNQMLQSGPDGVVYIGVFPDSLIKAPLAALAKKKIPAIVVAGAGGSKPSAAGPVYAEYAGPPHFAESGKLMGEAVVADSGSTKPKTALIFDPNLALVTGPVRTQFEAAVKGAGGTVGAISAASAQIGKQIPDQVVSYLQSHPDVKYLAAERNDFTVGVPQALKAAGLADKVKIVSSAPSATNVKDVESGAQFVTVAEEVDAGGWRSIDALLRIFVGADGYERNPVGWKQIISKQNVADVKLDQSGAPATPGNPDSFLKAWGVSGQ